MSTSVRYKMKQFTRSLCKETYDKPQNMSVYKVIHLYYWMDCWQKYSHFWRWHRAAFRGQWAPSEADTRLTLCLGHLGKKQADTLTDHPGGPVSSLPPPPPSPQAKSPCTLQSRHVMSKCLLAFGSLSGLRWGMGQRTSRLNLSKHFSSKGRGSAGSKIKSMPDALLVLGSQHSDNGCAIQK